MIPEKIKKKINYSIVRINAEVIEKNPNIPFQNIQPSRGQGTGFFIDKKGHILTCAHVVNSSKNIYVEIPHLSSQKIECDIVFFVPEFDLALLKTRDFKNKDYLELGKSNLLKTSDEVFAVGFPKSISTGRSNNIKYTTGIISGHQEGLLQTDTAINPGNSGGPLFYKNKVIGVNSRKLVGSNVSNIGYAVPIEYFHNVKKKDIIVHRPLLNCIINNMNENIVKKLTKNNDGVYISKVYPKSIFKDIKKEFILTKFDKYEIDNYGYSTKRWLNDKVHLEELIHFYKNDESINIEYFIDEKKEKRKIKLIPEKPIISMNYSNYEKTDFLIIGGAIMMNLNINHIVSNKMLLHKMDETHLYEKKCIISFILPNSTISIMNNFMNGDIIKNINEKEIKDLSDVRKALQIDYKINGKKCIKIMTSNYYTTILDYKKIINSNQRLMKIFNFNKKNIL